MWSFRIFSDSPFFTAFFNLATSLLFAEVLVFVELWFGVTITSGNSYSQSTSSLNSLMKDSDKSLNSKEDLVRFYSGQNRLN